MIESRNLRILPLSSRQLELYVRSDNSLIFDLKVDNKFWKISQTLNNTILYKIIPEVKRLGSNYQYATFWTIIDKKSNCIVGDICFKGVPNEFGEVEIGYGIHPSFQKKGFMTEAVSGIIQWAFEQENVNCIWAETEPTNFASQKVLINNGFEQIDASPTNYYWRILKNK